MAAQINIKTGYDARRKTLIDERATRKGLLDQEAHHWPFESLGFAYAVACLDIVLLHSDKANAIYREIVKGWELSGCQAILQGFKQCLPETNAWKTKALKAREKDETFPDWPSIWLKTYLEYGTNNEDFCFLLDKVNEFILVGFNRQIDHDNEAWKVIPDTSPLLKGVIILRSQVEYAKVKLEDLNKYRPARIDGKPYDLNAIMADKPTAGPERQIYRMLTTIYKKYRFTLKHDTKLLKDADQWYKCRVEPGTIEAYLQELADLDSKGQKPIYADQGRISNDIAACDEATGYPRKWRK